MSWIAVAVGGGMAAGSMLSGKGSGGVTYESPDPRNLYQEAMDTMRAQEEIVPRTLDLRRQYGPEQIALNTKDLRGSLFGTKGGTFTTQTQPTRRFTSGADFNAAVAEQYPHFWAAYQVSPHKKNGHSFKFWLKEHSENPKVTNVNPEEAKLAAKLVNEGIAEYAEGETEGQTVTRTVEAQEGLLGGPDAYRYDEQGNERGMAQRVDAYSREKVRQDIEAQRKGDIQDLRELAPEARKAYMDANPEVAKRLEQVNAMADRTGDRRSATQDYVNRRDAGKRLAEGKNFLGSATGLGGLFALPLAQSQKALSAGTDVYNYKPNVSNNLESFQRSSKGDGVRDYRSKLTGQTETERFQPSEITNLDNYQSRPISLNEQVSSSPAQPRRGQRPAPRSTATAQGTSYAQDRLGNISSLQSELEKQAREELMSGTGLTEREKRNLTEASRSAFGARGLTGSNRAIISEIQNQMAGDRQRLAERRAFAAGVSGQGEAMRRGRLQDTMGAGREQFGQTLARGQFGLAQDAQRFGQAATRDQLKMSQDIHGLNVATTKDRQKMARDAQLFGQAEARDRMRITDDAQRQALAESKDRFSLARDAQRFGQLGQQEQMRLAQDAQSFGQAATQDQLAMAQEGQDQTFALNALNASRVVDPSQAILGRPLTSSNAGAFQQTVGTGLAANQMNYDPFNNQYASNLYGQNYQGALTGAQGQMSANMYNSQVFEDRLGTGLGLAGSFLTG